MHALSAMAVLHEVYGTLLMCLCFCPGEDKRTTLMIKNIPNKYTQKMLLTTIDEKFRGTYDFFYLPIDFKNKCNVGYAFINMVRPDHIVPLVQKLDRKKWEKFNSEKVCNISYARIQVRSAALGASQQHKQGCICKLWCLWQCTATCLLSWCSSSIVPRSTQASVALSSMMACAAPPNVSFNHAADNPVYDHAHYATCPLADYVLTEGAVSTINERVAATDTLLLCLSLCRVNSLW